MFANPAAPRRQPWPLCLLVALAASWAGGLPAQAQAQAQAPATAPGTMAAAAAPAATAAMATPAVEGPPIVAQPLAPGERIRLDGQLNHPAWQRAPAHTQFVEKYPVTGGQPAQATEVRLLYDQQALYVGVRCWDSAPEQLRAPLVPYDGVNRTQDFVVAYLDAIGNRQSAQFFRINAAGSLGDGMHTAADDHEDFAPDFDWDGAAHRDAQGWTAVMRIPFASLRFTGQAEGPWRFMLARRVPRGQFFLYSSVLIPRDAPSFIHTLQPLQGVALPESRQFVTVRPGLTWRRRVAEPGDGSLRRETRMEASLDVKWRPLPQLVLDATLNPDFSQVALDVPQLQGNSRYALQYPEKRPFFFEATDLLRSPTEALYSRSITDPRWGLRGTWRGARLAGTAYAVDDRGGGLVLLPDTYSTGVAEQPGSQALVARVRGDGGAGAGSALQWGGLLAARTYEGGRGHNQVLGPDVGWQINPAWRLRAQWLQSHTTALAQANQQLGTGPAQAGHRGYLRLWYQSPQREADVWLDDVGAGFRDDLGFVFQNGVRSTGGRLGWGWQGVGPFNDLWLNLDGNLVQDRARGQLVSRDVFPSLWFTGRHNLEAWLQWHGGAAQRIQADAPLLGERYWKLNLTVTPARWMPLVTAEAAWGRMADVSAIELRDGARLNLTLTSRPLARLELEPKLSVLWLAQDGSHRYRETAHQLMARWHFDARHTLRAIVQHTMTDRRAEPANGLRAALPAFHDSATVGSLTYAWRQSSGTVMYLGASRALQRNPVSSGLGTARTNELFAKLQVDLGELAPLLP